MIKILTSEQIRKADEATIVSEPIASIDLMERASAKAFEIITRHFSANHYAIFCGSGNNGGDGLAIGRMLHNVKKDIYIYIFSSEHYSPDFLINRKRLEDIGVNLITLNKTDDFPAISSETVIIDALFGTGLNKPLSGLAESLVRHLNKHTGKLVSIDLPSGMLSGSPAEGIVTDADATITFQFPKLSLLLPDQGRHAGKLYICDIGINNEFISQAKTDHYLLQKEDIQKLVKKRNAFSHKGSFGRSLIIAGSASKTGAAILAAGGCLRSGSGSVTVAMPQSGITSLNAALPEAMTMAWGEEYIDSLGDISTFNAIGCGPGLGTHEATGRMIKMLIQNCRSPLVFDADAVNLLAENKTWLSFLPPGSVLTPHTGEFDYLAGKSSDSYMRMQLQKDLSKKYQIYILLKGHASCLSAPDGKCYFNPTGNSGMATAGSGDVLTGILTGLLAQGITPFHAALLAMYLHGLSGDLAATEYGEHALIASDLILFLGKAFLSLSEERNQ